MNSVADIPAVILAGGLGTRLRPVLPDTPKSLAPVEDRPFLEIVLQRLAGAGFRKAVLCIGYLGERIRERFSDGARLGIEIRYSAEEAPLGTGGALALARPLLPGTFLLMNGDTLAAVDLPRLAEFHRDLAARAGAVGTVAVTAAGDAGASGSVLLDDDGRIRSFREKDAAATESAFVNAGVYVFEESIFAHVPAKTPSSLEYDVIPAALRAGAPLFGFPFQGGFIDIGTKKGYEALKARRP